MNVDILDPPPPWWWYLPLAVGTMSLTVSIWIVFKRNETVWKALLHDFISVFVACADRDGLKLEENLEKKFAWLVESRGEKEEQ